MAGGGVDDGSTYSPTVGSVYIFNLIVGAGALAMPHSFSESGYLGGTVLIGVLAIMSYITVTFMVEAMAIANALLPAAAAKDGPPKNIQGNDKQPLLGRGDDKSKMYVLDRRVEMAAMAKMFFNRIGLYTFYVIMIVYLYGDLCIYAAAVPKSLRAVTCPHFNQTNRLNHSLTCLGPLDYDNTYRVYVGAFALIMGPFCFFDVQKTKFLQLFTTSMRWITFITLIVVAVIGIASRSGFTPADPPPPEAGDVRLFGAEGLASLFGTSIYSFMCHHSLPSLVTPISNKRVLGSIFGVVFLLVTAFYCLLCLTAVFRFPPSQLEEKSADLYTLLFQNFRIQEISYFLALFPVFVLSANFPIIAITLRNNLRVLFRRDKGYSPMFTKLFFPLLSIGPPFLVAFGTDDVGMLVSITGSYAGVGIQYLIPTMLCYYGRKRATCELGSKKDNPHRSWFSDSKWIVFVCIWSAICVGLVTFNHIYFRG